MQQGKKSHASEVLINGFINALINGVIYWFQIRGSETVMVTDNLISSTAHTVFSGAVTLATSLAFILSCITYFTDKTSGKPAFFPTVLLIALRNAVFAFGAVTITGILIQRYFGSLEVSRLVATLLTALIAGIVAGVVGYMTKKAYRTPAK